MTGIKTIFSCRGENLRDWFSAGRVERVPTSSLTSSLESRSRHRVRAWQTQCYHRLTDVNKSYVPVASHQRYNETSLRICRTGTGRNLTGALLGACQSQKTFLLLSWARVVGLVVCLHRAPSRLSSRGSAPPIPQLTLVLFSYEPFPAEYFPILQ